jgi:hypothetical protein
MGKLTLYFEDDTSLSLEASFEECFQLHGDILTPIESREI